jgi:uncharacterized protein
VSIRRLIRVAGSPARGVALGGIRLYRATLSGWLGGQCRFAPTCSQYAETAIREYGAIRGGAMALWRIARCNPYGKGGLDPVPPRGGFGNSGYDNVLHAREGDRH